MVLLTPPNPLANSYVTNTESITILSDFVQTASILTYLDASVLDRERALITASQRLQYECFKGVKTVADQPLAFPRKHLLRPGTDYLYLGVNSSCDDLLTLADLEPYFYPNDQIPLVIKQVTSLLAADYLAKPDLLGNSNATGENLYPIKKQKVDVLEVEYFETDTEKLNQSAYTLPPISGLALNLLAPLLCQDPYEELKDNQISFRQVRRS